MRFLHFLCAYVYVFNFLARLYWGFVGNKYAKWNNFFPLTKAQREEDHRRNEDRRACRSSCTGQSRPDTTRSAAFIYFFTFLAFWHNRLPASRSIQHEQFVDSADVHLDRAVMGGEMSVRYWHHLFLWFFVTFIVVHIYLAFYHDYIEGRGTISSIVGGWKFDRVNRTERNRVRREQSCGSPCKDR